MIIYTTVATTVSLLLFMAATVFLPSAAPWLKMVTSTGFIAMAIAAGGFGSLYGRMILAALFFSWWGDLFLISGKEKIFLLGLVAFLLGHLAFTGAFLAHGVDVKWLAGGVLLAALAAAAIFPWLNPHLDDMRYPVYAYMIVISAMVITSFGAWGRGATVLIVVGAVMFYVSDIFVARARFVAPGPWNGYIGLPLYYVAQMILALSISRVNGSAG